MIDETAILIDGEKRIGRYTVVLLTQTKRGTWLPSHMQLDTLVTNYRLMLRPFRKKYAPASLPAKYIASIEITLQDKSHCIDVTFVTQQKIYLMLSTGKLDHLYRDLCTMQSPQRYIFDDTIAKHDIERLITYFGKSPLDTSDSS